MVVSGKLLTIERTTIVSNISLLIGIWFQTPYQVPITFIIIFLQCIEFYYYTVLSIDDVFRVVLKTFDMDKFLDKFPQF